ncbi:DUF561 domain-containing protein [Lactiplantibacillus plantarum]|uniref:DUF561 domain-containing protein n=1 Tax=Lactiplantibacillus plantarum TaxID=1590 RepID=UPI00156F8D9E|nr:DUF561 domain-containing protein [Lactiplantibacillus plantarum]QKK58455.1 DUF561 domain-containing protein [Lactiplantibacillus plantarum]QSE52168.1 DUF561 domain-containing protein [Lactiplantibacillus plantarum]
MKNNLFSLLGSKYPIIQGAMTIIADTDLVKASQNAGILGVLGTGRKSTAEVEKDIEIVKANNNQSFGMNIMASSPDSLKLADLAVSSRVPFVTVGDGNALQMIRKLNDSNVKAFAIAPSVSVAKAYEEAGADALIVEGNEAGGHIGRLSTFTLAPQISQAVGVPVIAAGGISDGNTMAAAFAMGASGVQIGTLFAVSKESNASLKYKNAILASRDVDTDITGISLDSPVRGIRNTFTRKILKLEDEYVRSGGMTNEELHDLLKDSLLTAVNGDTVNGSIMAGANSGLIHQVMPLKDQVNQLIYEFNQTVNQIRRIEL